MDRGSRLQTDAVMFRILGPLEISGEDGPIPVAGQKQKAVLALLLLNAGRAVSTDRLIDALWGDEPPRTAATSLQNFVSQLRKALGPGVLVTKTPGYALEIEPGQLDLNRFAELVAESRTVGAEQAAALLREALSLWRGAPLADFAYDAFAAQEIGRLDDMRIAAAEQLIDAELELDRHAEVVPEVETLVALHPLRERLRGQLMLALYRSGRQAEALQAYHDARRVLVDELGIDPSPELQELYGRILRQERTLQPVTAAASNVDHYGDAVKALLAARLVPVLGPGVQLAGRPDNAVWEKAIARFPPDVRDAAAHLAREFGFPHADAGALSRVSQFVAVTRGVGPLYDELHELFARDYEPGGVHWLLTAVAGFLRSRGLPRQLIVSSGYDRTLERAFNEAGEDLDVVTYLATGRDRGKFLHVPATGTPRVIEEPNREVGLTTEERTVLLKIHGGADPGRERESYVVSEDDYIDYLVHSDVSAAVPVGLAAKLRRSHFLFLGYGLDDWSLRVFLRRLWGEERLAYRSWAVGTLPDPLSIEYWRDRGVDLFDVPIDAYVDELRRRVDEAVGQGVAV
jgi:DNA-binding SARP family transcriptional activator